MAILLLNFLSRFFLIFLFILDFHDIVLLFSLLLAFTNLFFPLILVHFLLLMFDLHAVYYSFIFFLLNYLINVLEFVVKLFSLWWLSSWRAVHKLYHFFKKFALMSLAPFFRWFPQLCILLCISARSYRARFDNWICGRVSFGTEQSLSLISLLSFSLNVLLCPTLYIIITIA